MAQKGSSTRAILALERAKIAFTTHPYPHDPAAPSYGREAATALGRDPDQVFKTLVVADPAHPRRLAMGLVPVSATLSLKAMATALGTKRIVMAALTDAERATGYVAGGISPIGQRQQLAAVLDHSAFRFDSVLVSGGRRGLDVELSPVDLRTVTHALVAAIAHGES